MKTIALIEDYIPLRTTLSRYFTKEGTFNILFSVSNILDALILKELKPDIILLDVNLAEGSSIDSIDILTEHFSHSKIIMLSNIKDVAITKRAIEQGASGFLLKTSSLSYISESLNKLSDGGNAFSPETIGHLLQKETIKKDLHKDIFTKRELELIDMLSKGLANKTAADKMNVTYFTVNQHLKNIYKKLFINSKTELISWYLKKQ